MRDDDLLLLAGAGFLLWILTRNRSPGTFSPDAPMIGEGMINEIIPMTVSASGRSFIKSQEGFRPTPYADANGQSIGYGHFLQAGENFTSLTRGEASNLMDQDLIPVEDAINGNVTVPINQNQFDALADFIYNVGIHAFETSTLLRKLNAGDYAGASAQFAQWANTNRRGADQQLFNS